MSACATQRGPKAQNEDAVFLLPELPGGLTLAVLCDGVSSSPGGGLAAEHAARAFGEGVVHFLTEFPRAPREIRACLAKGYAAAVERLSAAAAGLMATRADGDEIMQTTLMAVLAGPGRLHLTSIGDGEAWLLSREGRTCLTQKHTIAGQLAGVVQPCRLFSTPAYYDASVPFLRSLAIVLGTDGFFSADSAAAQVRLFDSVIEAVDAESVDDARLGLVLASALVERRPQLKDNATLAAIALPRRLG